MKASTTVLFLVMALLLGVSGCASVTRVATREVPRMEPAELKDHLDDPDLVVIDVRLDSDLAGSSARIKGAVRESNGTVAQWAPNYPKDKTIVLYCA